MLLDNYPPTQPTQYGRSSQVLTPRKHLSVKQQASSYYRKKIDSLSITNHNPISSSLPASLPQPIRIKQPFCRVLLYDPRFNLRANYQKLVPSTNMYQDICVWILLPIYLLPYSCFSACDILTFCDEMA